MNILLRRRKLGNGSCNGIKAASTTGIEVLRNDSPFPENVVGYVFRWGCTSNVPAQFTCVNSARSIHWCSDKRQGRLDMQEAGVSVPVTWAAEEFVRLTLDETHNTQAQRFVVRPATHAQGRHLFSGSLIDVSMAASTLEYNRGYVSAFVDKTEEYRVAVISGRVAWVAQKTPGNPEDVAWNVARGGRFDNVKWTDWPMLVVKEALKAAKVSGADFCGVDVMVDIAGTPYVLEVNSAPSQTSPYRQQCFAKCFDYIVTNGTAHFPEVAWSPRTSWKSTIHPALKTE